MVFVEPIIIVNRGTTVYAIGLKKEALLKIVPVPKGV
jgi:hypothetical protein